MLKCLAVLVAASLAAAPAPAPVPKSVTAFVNVSVVPMDQERVLARQTVLIRGNRIVEMGPVDKVHMPKDAVQIDGRGKFLIPGLGDMHTHVHVHFPRDPASDSVMLERMLFLYLANGVTTIRNMQDIDLAWRKRAASGKLLSPRIYSSGHKLFDDDFPSPGNDSVVNILSPTAAAAAVEREKAAGYDFLKIYNVRRETFDSIVAAADRLGIRFAGHVPLDVPLERALEARYMSIEHLTGYLPNAVKDAPDSSKMAALAAATKRAGVWNCPTNTVIENFTVPAEQLLQRPEMRYIADERLELWQNERASTASGTIMEPRRKLIRALHDAGAGLLLGTDSPDNFGVPGFSIHRELEALVAVGLTPYQALETGTRNIAAFFGTLDSTGIVGVGKRADLVLLSGNPLVDIHHTTNPVGVMIGGRWLSRQEIDARLTPIEKGIY